MQRFSRQTLLLRTKVELTRRKEHLIMLTISLVPKWSRLESAMPLEKASEIVECTVRVGRLHPSDWLKLEMSKVADSASSLFNFFNLCTKFNGEKISQQICETTLRVRSKVAPQYYKCQGIGHFAKECPAQRRRGRTRNSPGKGNPNERSRSRR
jgi:hypothetical protein